MACRYAVIPPASVDSVSYARARISNGARPSSSGTTLGSRRFRWLTASSAAQVQPGDVPLALASHAEQTVAKLKTLPRLKPVAAGIAADDGGRTNAWPHDPETLTPQTTALVCVDISLIPVQSGKSLVAWSRMREAAHAAGVHIVVMDEQSEGPELAHGTVHLPKTAGHGAVRIIWGNKFSYPDNADVEAE